MTEKEIYEVLDEAGLTAERALISKKIFLMRYSIICKYILMQNRSEAIAHLYKISNEEYIICEKTYDRYIRKALKQINKKI